MSSLFVPVWAHRAVWKKLLKLVCCCCPMEHGNWNVGMGGVTQKIWYCHIKAPLKIVVRTGKGHSAEVKCCRSLCVLPGEGEIGFGIYRPATLARLFISYFGHFPVLHCFKYLVQIIPWDKENNPPKWLNFFPDENKIPTLWNFDQSSAQILEWKNVHYKKT